MLIVIAVVVVVFLFFGVLQLVSNRTYKPTISEIIHILEAYRDRRWPLEEFDEFSCVRIAYDPRLDAVREKFNQIFDEQENVDGILSAEDAASLIDVGNKKIAKLIEELRQLQA